MALNVDDILIPPSSDQLKLIRDELNEDEDRAKHLECLLHEWMDCQPHFPKNYDKRVTRTFLKNCKYNMDKTKSRLECHFTVKNLFPEIFSERTTSGDIARALDTVTLAFLPQLTENGNRISVYKLENADVTRFNVDAINKLCFMIYDVILTSQQKVAGEINIFDGAGITAGHLVKFLTIIKTVTPILREAYAIRLKEIHIVNAPPILDKILTVAKPILHQKVRNAFVNHSSVKSLCAHFGEEIMPSDYGGKCESLAQLMKNWRNVLNNSEEWFREQENVKITKTAPKKIESLYFKGLDVEGSFRTLQID